MKKYTVTIIIVALLCCFSVAPMATAASDEEEVLQIAYNFTKAFNTLDYKLMSSLHSQSTNLSKYTPDKEGAFLIQGWEAIGTDWKTMFESLPPGALRFSQHNQQATFLTKDVAMVTQYLISVYADPTTNADSITHYRQTLVVQKIGGKWLIVHEHVSHMPTE